MYWTKKRPINLTTTHGRRLKEKIELRQSGHTPTKPSYVWRVECSEIPQHIKSWAVKGLTTSATHIWLRRRDAWELVRWAKAEGLRAERIRTEYRQCAMCKRIMLGLDAANHRAVMEQSYLPDEEPCSPDCKQRYWNRKRK